MIDTTTPRPWRVTEFDDVHFMAGIQAPATPEQAKQYGIPEGVLISLLGVLEDGTAMVATKADAHLIVRAVNAHDELREALADSQALVRSLLRDCQELEVTDPDYEIEYLRIQGVRQAMEADWRESEPELVTA